MTRQVLVHRRFYDIILPWMGQALVQGAWHQRGIPCGSHQLLGRRYPWTPDNIKNNHVSMRSYCWRQEYNMTIDLFVTHSVWLLITSNKTVDLASEVHRGLDALVKGHTIGGYLTIVVGIDLKTHITYMHIKLLNHKTITRHRKRQYVKYIQN